MMKKIIALCMGIGMMTAMFMLSPTVNAAQTVPYKMNFQGRLTDISGNVLPNGLYNLRFRLMSASSGGSNLWQADRVYTGSGTGDHRVQVTNGIFSVQLGDTATGVGDPALSPSIFNTQTNATVYLEIELPTPATAVCATVSCASWAELAMTPRQLVAATPYSLNADTVDGIDGAALAQLASNNTFTGNKTFTGNFLYQPATDSTTAFQIQNNAGAALLVADTTSNLALKVGGGDVSPSATPALLVLDYKNTAGDPTSVDGAMYYNSFAAKFRCQEGGLWKDCIPEERERYAYHSDLILPMITVANGNAVDSTITLGTSGTGAFTRVAAEANRPGILRFATGTGTNGLAEAAPNYDVSNLQNGLQFGAGAWSFMTQMRVTTISDATNRFTTYSGFFDNQNQFQATGNPHNGCYMRYVDNQNTGKWQGVCRNGDNETGSTCDTGVTVAINTWYALKIAVNPAGTLATFVVDETNTCTVSTNIPSTNRVSFGMTLLKNAGTTSRTVDYDYIEVLGTGLARF